MRKVSTLILFVFFLSQSFAQVLPYARRVIDTLSSPGFHGRGYVNDGLNKAAGFLSDELKLNGVKPLNGNSFLQTFSFPVNSFPDDMELSINDEALVPGRDFIVSPESRGIKETCKLIAKDSAHFVNEENRIVVSLVDKLTWSVSTQVISYTHIRVLKEVLNHQPQKIKLDIDNEYLKDFKASNICGVIKGSDYPDSLIVFTAHYDHLGRMGNATYFPGANDNASGVSLVLNLMKHYAANPPKLSVAFLFFAGEEAGLIGSKYFSENPLFDLTKVRFLINTDLAGTGQEGITVVNATLFGKEFSLLKELNENGRYLPKVLPRGKAANSDHYWFTEKGVPSFFIYTMGGIRAYHDIYDRAETLPLSEYEDLYKLLIRFNSALMKAN